MRKPLLTGDSGTVEIGSEAGKNVQFERERGRLSGLRPGWPFPDRLSAQRCGGFGSFVRLSGSSAGVSARPHRRSARARSTSRTCRASRGTPFDLLDESPDVVREVVKKLLGEDSVAVRESLSALALQTAEDIAKHPRAHAGTPATSCS